MTVGRSAKEVSAVRQKIVASAAADPIASAVAVARFAVLDEIETRLAAIARAFP